MTQYRRTQSRSAIRDTSTSFGKALLHPSILVVIVPSILLATRSRWGMLNLDAATLASATFSVAGTMVAVILPASQLVDTYLTRFEEHMKTRLSNHPLPPDRIGRMVKQNIEDLRAHFAPAWRASAFIFVSFLLSITAIIFPEREIHICQSFVTPLRSLTAVLSIAFLVVGSMWFLPAAKYAFGLKTLDALERILTAYTNVEKAQSDAPEAVAGNQATDSSVPKEPEVPKA